VVSREQVERVSCALGGCQRLLRDLGPGKVRPTRRVHYFRGKPRTRSAMMLRWISEVPAKMVAER